MPGHAILVVVGAAGALCLVLGLLVAPVLLALALVLLPLFALAIHDCPRESIARLGRRDVQLHRDRSRRAARR